MPVIFFTVYGRKVIPGDLPKPHGRLRTPTSTWQVKSWSADCSGMPTRMTDPAETSNVVIAPASTRKRRAKARIGQMLCDRWRIDSLLGIGGMAAVFGATDRSGMRVAIKLLHAELSSNPDIRRRFLDEGYAANRIGHPATISILEDGLSDDGEVFLVMDCLEGETLDDRIVREGPVAPAEVLFIADTLLDVLAAAHAIGIVHRDVKPDNVFLTRDGQVKLFDFGIARMSVPGRTSTTLDGAPLGTPSFLPPEQARGRSERIDGRTDLWALGATMFTALTGKLVHDGETDHEALLLAMTQPAPLLGDIAPLLSKEVVRIVDRALAFDKDARWPDARAMQVAVRAVTVLVGSAARSPMMTLFTESTPPVVFAPLDDYPSPPLAAKDRAGTRGLAWAAVAVVLVVTTFALMRRSDPASSASIHWSPADGSSDDAVRPLPTEAVVPPATATLPDAALASIELAPIENRPRPPQTNDVSALEPSSPPAGGMSTRGAAAAARSQAVVSHSE
jgi:serine/threonine protein kinase